MDTISVTKITILRRKDGCPHLRPCGAVPKWHTGTPFFFVIVSQGVVPCYHHTD